MENQKKILTRIQLINWHYFENERISLHGSTLISGENTAGKSTILDAIQLVLTTNTRKFNVAANEKGNRNLKGYVRCKIGNVGETYLRKNAVPANVALEFYEEKGNRYFVIGVHMLSPDEESRVETKWYVEECRLEDLSFVVEGRPARAEEFLIRGKRIRYIEQMNAAKDRFKRRMGNLEDKFFDIIPKSLAFKPMDNVKDFINKFVLSENQIDVASLRSNIETLSELEELLERSKKQLNALETILEKHQRVEAKEYDIKVNELLLAIAGKEARKEELEKLEQDIRLKSQAVESGRDQIAKLERQIRELDDQIVAVNVALKSNESHQMAEEVKRRIDGLYQEQKELEEIKRKLSQQIQNLKGYLRELAGFDYKPITPEQVTILEKSAENSQKQQVVATLETFQGDVLEGRLRQEAAACNMKLAELDREIEERQNKLKELERRKLTYPQQTEELKAAIEREFVQRGIDSKVYILAELLEITDPKWTDAVEGYLHTQKFYLVVEPEYYNLALEIYHRKRKVLHTAGIINTRKLPLDQQVNQDSLSYVVHSENRYGKAYVNYLLGRVIRCEELQKLEEYPIAITPECMLYQGYVVRHLNPRDYRDPYIGQNAYRVQIVNVREELEEKSSERREIRERAAQYSRLFEASQKVKPELLKLYMYAPSSLAACEENLIQAKIDLASASQDPTYIELNFKLDQYLLEKGKLEQDKNQLVTENNRLEIRVEEQTNRLDQGRVQQQEETRILEQRADEDGAAYREASQKYQTNRRSKSAKTIAENYAPQRQQFLNEREQFLNGPGGLKELQHKFNQEYAQDFLVGMEGIADYRETSQKLKAVEMVRYEEKLKQAKDDCQEIFKSDFLSKMKEHIEGARNEFRSLNKALDHIYYGDDSYHFKLSFDKKKEGLYRMITSEYNQEGMNLWTSAFEAEYQEEMAELFDKLMTKDDQGQKIVEEYTDYRSYLDYDIEIHKRDGSIQRFSDIYGEKSGSETQVPYYVAIAASFYQLYRYGNSVRLMLLDEAFDKMDDDRIQSMMDFFNGLGLQVILATPPAKIEIIGEKVGTILTAIRVGQNSIVEEYDLA